MTSDDSFQLRFNELRQRAKRGVLAPDERTEYDDVKERFARAVCAAQNVLLAPGQRARSSFRVGAMYKVELTLSGAAVKAATMDVGVGGFSSLLGVPAAPGAEVSFKMQLSSRDAISGKAVTASAERERSGKLYRVSFAFRDLKEADAALLEEALFDALLLRKLTPPAPMLSPPGAMPVGRGSSPEVRRTSSASMPAVRAPAAATHAGQAPPGPKVVEAKAERGSLSPERMRSVDALLDETMGEMQGATQAARREEMPVPRAHLPSAPQDDSAEARSSTPPRSTPLSLTMEPGKASPRAPRTRRSPFLFPAAAILASVVAMGLAWRLARTWPASPARATSAAAAPIAPSVATPAPAACAAPPPVTDPPPTPPSFASAVRETPRADQPAPTEGGIKVVVPGRRVFIDGRLAGEGPRTFSTSCGTHTVRVGSAGTTQSINVPCGGEVIIAKP